SKEKMINALAVLPAADRLDIAIKGDDLKINCNFCKEKYTITVDEFKAHFGE
ncbi:MAG: Hsp33 family molecular chaperone HslO, partial [Lentisphaeria bacterium]|nr:Hsp33 family molecular chaperone HslO [Lentisphaeria bacterium]